MAAETVEVAREIEVTKVVEVESRVLVSGESAELAGEEGAPGASTGPGGGDLSVATANRLQSQRLIIKNGEIVLEVDNSPTAVDGVVQVAVDYGRYVISHRVWQQHKATYATITIGLPVGESENVMRCLRTMVDRVLNETASGTDVTDEYVDPESKLENLEAISGRIRTFLEQATEVEELPEVNRQLSEMEGQIAQVQGRINYLGGRAAYSTITVYVEPVLPTPSPTPTPTATPTSTPTATPDPWRPAETAQKATGRLTDAVQALVDALIYNGIICGPFLALLAGGAWVAYRLWRRSAK